MLQCRTCVCTMQFVVRNHAFVIGSHNLINIKPLTK